MVRTRMKSSGFHFTVGILVLCAAVFIGCAQTTAVKETEADATPAAPEKKMITGLRTAETDDTALVFIDANQELTYTSVKQMYPSGILIYFPDTELFLMDVDTGSIETSDILDVISTSEITDKGTTARVEILMKQDVPYEVSESDNGLTIAFTRPETALTTAETTAAAATAATMAETESESPPATRLEVITYSETDDGLRVDLKGDGTIADFKSFTVTNPARIVFDIYNLKSSSTKEERLPVDSQWLKRIRHYTYPDRLRVVLDTRPDYLNAFQAAPTRTGLAITLGAPPAPPALSEAAAVSSAAGPAETESAEAETAPAEETTAPVPAVAAAAAAPAAAMASDGKPAWINRVDFTSKEQGKSTLMIGTTKPVAYDMTQTDDRTLRLLLANTRIPTYRQRPLITTRFNSAVDRITPIQTPKTGNDAVVTIELREDVPYVVEQIDNLLVVDFEASSIPPKPFEQANLPEWKRVLSESATAAAQAPEAAPAAAPAAPAAAPAPTAAPMAAQPAAAPAVETLAPGSLRPGQLAPEEYTGEKIALDFYETDIKNVFRILREVSGKNFAIDKNVTGKVTLTLEKPVPWDQVLALVLKMNQLGMTYEGDIIRIATLQTLAKEEELRRGNLEAKLRAEEQQKALEPLITEYIPISYANASSEIRPLLEPLLTKGRGTISVDDRTNLIILTDTAEVVDRAKTLVLKLDAVTPQVIIEARVVEATTQFTRDLGIDWSTTIGPNFASGQEGGTIAYNAAVNLARGAGLGTLGLNFSKLTGSLATLDATLVASETQSKTKIISAPKVTTLDNKAATIKQGLQYPFNKLDADGNTTTEFIDIVLQLTVTPHVTPDNRISMVIKVTKSDLAGIVNNQQSFNTIESENELLVNDGETVVIAGIIKTTGTEAQDSVPGLKNVPLLGWFFKNQGIIDNKEELLIFITPRILRLEQRTFS